jgi:hypothetical protein
LVWPGTSGTLSQFGYGALGEIGKHAKKGVGLLRRLQKTLPREEYLLLAAEESIDVPENFGMPAWEPRVRTAVKRPRGKDHVFIEYFEAAYNTDFAVFLDTAPPIVREDLHQVEHALLNAPYNLGAETLEWFAWNPVL